MWKLLQYRRLIDELLDAHPTDLDSVEIRLDLVAERGNQCRRPIWAPVEDGIFELRGRGSTRLLYYFRPNREIVFVHSVDKRKSKLDRRDIARAKAVRKQIEEDEKQGNIEPFFGRN